MMEKRVHLLALLVFTICDANGLSFSINYQNDTFLKDGVPFR